MKTPPHTTQPLRIGILGCANIAKQFARDVAASSAVKIVAVASRKMETATTFAAAQGIGRAHGSYEALLSDAEVDAIYLPLPNSLHAEWAIKAAQSGKHILCEKPLALNRREAHVMFDAAKANGVMLLEVYPYYFQPQTGDMLALLHGGAIGTVSSMQACFGFTLPNPQGNIRLNPELGGGALLDAGSYALSMIRLVMGCAPQHVQADATWADAPNSLAPWMPPTTATPSLRARQALSRPSTLTTPARKPVATPGVTCPASCGCAVARPTTSRLR